MTKLSKAQEAILNEAKKDIDEARSFPNFEEFYQTKYKSTFDETTYRSYFEMIYDELTNGIVRIYANTRTLSKLEELGYIKVMSVGGSYTDKFQVIGY